MRKIYWKKLLTLQRRKHRGSPIFLEEARFILWNKAPLKIAECLFVEGKLYSFGVDKENSLPSFSW